MSDWEACDSPNTICVQGPESNGPQISHWNLIVSKEMYRTFIYKNEEQTCERRVTAGISEKFSSSIGRLKCTSWNAERYQITAVGEGRAAKQGSLVADPINQSYSRTCVSKHKKTHPTANNNLMHVCCVRHSTGILHVQCQRCRLTHSY